MSDDFEWKCPFCGIEKTKSLDQLEHFTQELKENGKRGEFYYWCALCKSNHSIYYLCDKLLEHAGKIYTASLEYSENIFKDKKDE